MMIVQEDTTNAGITKKKKGKVIQIKLWTISDKLRKITLTELWTQLTPDEKIMAKTLFGNPYNKINYEYTLYINGHYKQRKQWYEQTERIQYFVKDQNTHW